MFRKRAFLSHFLANAKKILHKTLKESYFCDCIGWSNSVFGAFAFFWVHSRKMKTFWMWISVGHLSGMYSCIQFLCIRYEKITRLYFTFLRSHEIYKIFHMEVLIPRFFSKGIEKSYLTNFFSICFVTNSVTADFSISTLVEHKTLVRMHRGKRYVVRVGKIP